ncbi:MAG: hypothetical protein Q4D33_11365, partial [Prevotellaceae bacterium]|nr:hypothetical protein [Prevotellaceae bacterium]
ARSTRDKQSYARRRLTRMRVSGRLFPDGCLFSVDRLEEDESFLKENDDMRAGNHRGACSPGIS